MKKILALSVFAILPVFASLAKADAASTKRDIYNLAYEVQNALVDTRASDANLTAAKTQLQNALNLLRSSGGGNPVSDECIKFAYDQYFRSLNSADSMDKAGKACRMNDDLEVMKYLYAQFFRSMNSVQAMDNAAEYSKAPVAGKLSIVKYAFDQYFRSLNAADSAKKAGEGARKVNVGSEGCLKTAYDNYFRSKNSVDSMDAAFAFCASN